MVDGFGAVYLFMKHVYRTKTCKHTLTHTHAHRQTDRHTYRYTYRHTNIYNHISAIYDVCKCHREQMLLYASQTIRLYGLCVCAHMQALGVYRCVASFRRIGRETRSKKHGKHTALETNSSLNLESDKTPGSSSTCVFVCVGLEGKMVDLEGLFKKPTSAVTPCDSGDESEESALSLSVS